MAATYDNATLQKLRQKKAKGIHVQGKINAEKARLGAPAPGAPKVKLGIGTQRQAINTARQSITDQQKMNMDANRVSQQGPFGNRSFAQNPDGSWTAKDDLGAQQGLFDNQMELETGAAGAGTRQLTTAGLDTAFGAGSDYNTSRQKAEDASYGRLTKGFDDTYSKEKQQFEQDLYNRGYRPDQTGEGQYTDMMKDFEGGWADRRDSARLQSVQEGGAEFDRMFEADRSTRQQRVSDLQNLNRVGTGLRDPGYFGLSPVQVGNPDLVGAATQSEGASLGRKKLKQDAKFQKQQLKLQRQQLAMQGRSMGGGKEDTGAYYSS